MKERASVTCCSVGCHAFCWWSLQYLLQVQGKAKRQSLTPLLLSSTFTAYFSIKH
jgi:hypothetical protein